MKKLGKLHIRIGIVYSLLSLFFMFIFGLTFYLYNARSLKKEAFDNIDNISNKITIQLENSIGYMDFISLDCISRTEFINALRELAVLSKGPKFSDNNLNNIYSAINNNIIKESVIRNVSRLSVFNSYGDFFTSHFNTIGNKMSILRQINQLNWINNAREANGSKVIIPPYKDPWAKEKPKNVFSLVRMVRDPGQEVGFIEVQASVAVLDSICNFENQYDVILYDENKRFIYSTIHMSEQLFNYYINRNSNLDKSKPMQIQNNSITGGKEILSHSFSEYLDWNIIVIQDVGKVLQPLNIGKNMIYYVTLLLILASILLSYIIAKKLTQPIRELRDHVEKINIESLSNHITISSEGIDEIESLKRAFSKMLNRLNMAIQQEMKAYFDSLQAQMNPHFIYNMLNIIANMGLEIEGYEIADTCRRVSEMLRFSTSNVDKKTTIEDEINHVSNYLFLMKKRYEHKFEYQIDVDDHILGIEIPKLVLQPLVENAIHHGFNNSKAVMKIFVKGTVYNGNWRVDIIDNGSGFSSSILEDLRQKIQVYENEIYNNKNPIGLSIGGMGIVNTFIRLSLFFNRENRFKFGNNRTSGAFISIGGKINGIEGEGKHV